MNTPTDNNSQPNSLDLDYDMWAGLFEFVGPTNTANTSLNNARCPNNGPTALNNSGYQLKFGLDRSEASQAHTDKRAMHGSSDSLEDLNLNFNSPPQQLAPLNSLTSSAYSYGGYASSETTATPDFEYHKQLPMTGNAIRPILLHDQEQFLSLNPADFDDIVPSSSGPSSLIYIENNLIAHGSDALNGNEHDNSSNNNNKLFNYESFTQKFTNANKKTKTNNTNTNGFKLENLKNFKNKLISEYDEKSPLGSVNAANGVPFVNECIYSSEHIANNNTNNNNNSSPSKLHSGIVSAELCENLNEQLELLQRQVTDLADTQNIAEDRTVRTKTEYAVLQARYHMLEEQYRESELRAEERLAEEQKRYRELLARVEREAELQNENCQFKIKTIELEATALREEQQRLRLLCDKQANDLHRTEEKLELANDQIALLQQDLDEAKRKERVYEKEKKAAEELMLELGKELERLRAETGPAMPTTSPEAIRLEELHQELEEMRQKNRVLEEQNEELQAQVLTRGVEEGRQLLNGTLNSLAQELEEMSQAQLQQAFQAQEEEISRLKKYIDNIVLNIVETYPQLLEIKENK